MNSVTPSSYDRSHFARAQGSRRQRAVGWCFSRAQRGVDAISEKAVDFGTSIGPRADLAQAHEGAISEHAIRGEAIGEEATSSEDAISEDAFIEEAFSEDASFGEEAFGILVLLLLGVVAERVASASCTPRPAPPDFLRSPSSQAIAA